MDEDGSFYKGSWRSNTRHGQGEASYKNGSSYKGTFQYDTYHGKGDYQGDDYTYSGAWTNGAPLHGVSAVLSLTAGVGVAGLKDGHGVYSESNGVRYEGQWKKNSKHGTGSYVAADGASYTGGSIREWLFPFAAMNPYVALVL